MKEKKTAVALGITALAYAGVAIEQARRHCEGPESGPCMTGHHVHLVNPGGVPKPIQMEGPPFAISSNTSISTAIQAELPVASVRTEALGLSS